MVSFSQLLFSCNQDEDFVGSEIFLNFAIESENAFKPYFQQSSSTSRLLVGEIQSCDTNLDVGRKEAQYKEDCRIIELTNKKTCERFKKKILTKKKNKKEEVEEKNIVDKKKKWLDNDVE